MSFLSPLMLVGLLAVAVPIAVHLIHRRKAVRRAFPAIELLRSSDRRLARGLRLKQLLLLALRIATFVLLPLAMAQPYILWRRGGGATDRLPAAVVLIVDVSASMTAGDGARFASAIDRARQAIDDLRPWDEVALVAAGAEPIGVVDELSGDRAAVLDALDELRPTGAQGDLQRALGLASDILATTRQPRRRTIVITDQDAASWGDLTRLDPARVPALGELAIIDVTEGEQGENTAVTELSAEPSPDGGEDAWQLDATIRSWGRTESGAVSATLAVDGAVVATTIVDVPHDRAATATFTHPIEGGGLHRIEVSIDDAVGLQADNSREIPLVTDGGVRVLLVDGDARPLEYDDELFYLRAALQANMDEQSTMVVETTTPDAFAAQPLGDIDVIVLANVAMLAPEAIAQLQAWVEAGGGLLFSMGSNIDAARYNAAFGALLPRPLRDITRLATRDDPDAGIKATRFGALDRTHPVFRVFDLPGGESIQNAAVYQYVLLEPSADSDSRIVASYGDGGPAIVERTFGRGRLMLITTTLDFDWNDLPIRTAYLPLVHRLTGWLGRQGASTTPTAAVGSEHSLDVESLGATALAIVARSGARTVVEANGGRVLFTPLENGLHQVALLGDEGDTPAPDLAFSAATPASESRVERVDGAALDALQRGLTPDGNVADVEENRARVWPVLLFVALLVLYLESLVALRRRVWEQLRARFA
jgi:hypothetical protein